MSKKRTEVEEMVISAICNFWLWYGTDEERDIVEEYMDNEHTDYNDWFEIKKDKKNDENR
jgi:hypothetical protein